MLDKLKEEYEESITNQLENFKSTVSEALGTANANTSQANTYLAAIAKANGYEIKDDANLKNIEKIIETKTAEIKDSPTTTPDNSNKNSTSDSSGNNGNQNSTTTTSTPQTMPTIPADNTFSSITPARLADNYISTHVKKIKNAKGNYNKDEYSDVNKAIMKVYDGKALTTKQFKKLAKTLGIKYDNATKKGTLYKKLKKIDAYGFKTGGIAELIKAQGEDGIAFVRNKEGLVAPEHVPAIQELLDTVPLMNNMFKPLVEAPKLPNLTPMNNMGNNVTFGDVHYVFDMPNVVDEQSFLNTMQSSQKIQKCMRSMTIDQLSGAGRLSCKSIK